MIAGVFDKIDLIQKDSSVHFKQRKNKNQTNLFFLPTTTKLSVNSLTSNLQLQHVMLKAMRRGFTTRSALLCSGAAPTQRERGPGSVSSPELHSCREGETGERGQQHPAAKRTWLQWGRSSSTSRWAHGQGKGKGISDYFKWRLATEVDGHRSSLIIQSHVPLLLQQCWACLSLSYFIRNNHLRPICPKYSDLLKGLHFPLFWQRYVLTYLLLLSSPEGHSKNKIK